MKSTKLPIANEVPPSAYQKEGFKIPRAQRYWETAQNVDGSEHLSPISLVADVDMHPLTLGEQLNRFLAAPDFIYDDDGNDIDLDRDYDDTDTMTAHEDRTLLTANELKRRKQERQKVRDAERVKQEQEEMDRFAERLEARRRASDQPPIPPTGDQSEGA